MLDAELRRETDEVMRTHGELLRRLALEGVGGVADLIERFQRIQKATRALSVEEIDNAISRIEALVGRLEGQRAQLEELSRMRSVLRPHAGGPEGGGRETLD